MSESQTQRRKIDEDVDSVKAKLDTEECMELAVEAGKPRMRQLYEIFRLSRMTGQLQGHEYYYFQLYDDSQFSFEDKTRFASERFGNHLITCTNDVDWHYLSTDKFKSYCYLDAQSFPIPETQAIMYEREREFEDVPKLESIADVKRFFESEARFPLYAKPVFGIGSIGNFLIRGYENGMVRFHDDSELSLEDFYRQVEPKHAYMLQTLLTPQTDLIDVSPLISTVRLVVMYQNGQPQIIHSLWKIPSAANIADNFWRKGNMLANLDSETGRINRFIRGTGPWLENLNEHPESGIQMMDYQVPHWPEIVDMCIEGAKSFSPLRFQSWDIGLAKDGPVVVEVNSGSALGLAQLAQGRGFLTDEFLLFLDEHNCKLKRRPKLPQRKSVSRQTLAPEPKKPLPTFQSDARAEELTTSK